MTKSLFHTLWTALPVLQHPLPVYKFCKSLQLRREVISSKPLNHFLIGNFSSPEKYTMLFSTPLIVNAFSAGTRWIRFDSPQAWSVPTSCISGARLFLLLAILSPRARRLRSRCRWAFSTLPTASRRKSSVLDSSLSDPSEFFDDTASSSSLSRSSLFLSRIHSFSR